jgi:hypothetical protein
MMRPCHGLLLTTLAFCASCTVADHLGNEEALGTLGHPPHSNGTCNQGLSICNNLCTDLQGDASNCSQCGQACGAKVACVQGTCAVGTPSDAALPNDMTATCGVTYAVCTVDVDGGSWCCGGLSCIQSICQPPPCGAAGQSCCPNNYCVQGLTCTNGTCQ